MFTLKRQIKEQLDHAGRVVLRAVTLSDDEIEAAASSPFLYTRLRAAIAGEKIRREESSGLLPLLFVARRAVPAMALIAVFSAILMVMSMQTTVPVGFGIEEEALSDTRDPGVEQTVLSKNGLSREEVFGIVVDTSGGRDSR